MKSLLVLALVLACGSAQFIYPDEFERMKQEANQRLNPWANRYPTTQQLPDYQQTANVPNFQQQLPSFQPARFKEYTMQWSPPNTIQDIRNGNSEVIELRPGQVLPASTETTTPQPQQQQQQQPQVQPASAETSSLLNQILPPRWRDHVLNIISRGITKFTLDIDRELEKLSSARSDSLIFSPASLTATLAMVLLASGGKTFEEVAKILGLESGIDISNHSEIMHQIFGLLIQESDRSRLTNPSAPRGDFAFGMFVQDGFPIRPEFKNISEKVYKNEVSNVDFIHHGAEAKEKINKWVNQKTMGKIKDMLSMDPDPSTQVMILSALYFNGEWNTFFYEGATSRREFTVEPNEKIYVDMMFNGGQFMFVEDRQLDVKMIEFPYKGKEVSMFALMPNVSSATALKDFKSKLTPEILEELIGNMKNQTCVIGFPRMKLSSTLGLRGALQALGLESLFNPATADLSVLSPGRNVNPETPQQQQPRPEQQPQQPNPGQQQQPQQPYPGQQQQPQQPYPGQQQQQPQQPYPGQQQQQQQQQQPILQQQQQQPYPGQQQRSRPEQQQEFGRPQRKLVNNYNIGVLQPVKNYVSNFESSWPNYYRYQEAKSGYTVERWNTGFNIRNDRFNSVRWRRQAVSSRPIDQEFVDFLNSQNNLPKFGVDELRNSAGISNPGLWADEVMHKVEMTINEKGTEAAAGTSVGLNRSGDFKRFIANKPFLFFIRHKTSKIIWFWGTINRPSPHYNEA